MCRVPGCPNLHERQRTVCSAHRHRLWRYGDVQADVPITPRRPRGSGSIKNGYLYVPRRGHPLVAADGNVKAHRVVLYEAIGPGVHACHWCGCPIDWDVRDMKDPRCLTVDHLNDVKDDNRLENLVASCGPCNTQRAHGAQLSPFVLEACGF